jgi:hypothetical protein
MGSGNDLHRRFFGVSNVEQMQPKNEKGPIHPAPLRRL